MRRSAKLKQNREINIFLCALALVTLALPAYGAPTVKRRPRVIKTASPSAGRRAIPVMRGVPRRVPRLLEDGRFDAATAALLGRSSRSVAADFLLGYLRLHRGAASRALPSLRRAAKSAWPLKTQAQFWAAKAALTAGDVTAAIPALRAFLATGGSTWRHDEAQLLLAMAYQQRGNLSRALQAYRRLSPRAPRQLRRQAAFHIAQTLEAQGRLAKAARAHRDIWLNDPTSEFGQRAELAEDRVSTRLPEKPPPPSETSLSRRAALLYDARRFQGAHLAAAQTIELYPHGSSRPQLELLQGVSLYHLRRNHEGRRKLASLLRRYGDTPQAVEARYWLTKFAYRMNDREPLLGQARYITRRHSTSEFADNVSYIIAAHLSDTGNLTAGTAGYRSFLTAHPGSPLRDNAHWALGWNLYRLRRYTEAEAEFTRLMRRSKNNALAAIAAYWSARCRERLGKQAAAARRYAQLRVRWPETYVAAASAKRFKRLQGNGYRRLPPIPGPTLKGPSLGNGDWPMAPLPFSTPKALRAYADLGLVREAAAMAQADLTRTQWRRYRVPLSHLLARAGRYDRARAVLESVSGAMTPEQLWRTAYPFAYRSWVGSLATAEGVNKFLPLAVIRAESAFNPDAVSPTGAVGLMQLMPSTARSLAAERKWPQPKPRDLRDPFLNMRYGIAELSRLSRRFNGNLILTIAGYNADADRVAQWWASRDGMDDDEFIAAIPFTETRHYVQKVLANLHVYRRLYGRPSSRRGKVN